MTFFKQQLTVFTFPINTQPTGMKGGFKTDLIKILPLLKNK